jgi:hypothetical protein
VTTPHGSRARGFWNDSDVSSHTDRSVHAHERDKLKATHVSHGTLDGWRVTAFTQGNGYPGTPKQYWVVSVQENMQSIAEAFKKCKLFFSLWAAVLDIALA